MEYSLVKKLKDAGYPQKESGIFAFPPAGTMSETERMRAMAYEPTLPELIADCGDDFRGLLQINSRTNPPPNNPPTWVSEHGDWFAFSKIGLIDFISVDPTMKDCVICVSKTPEGAVVDLWCATHSKTASKEEKKYSPENSSWIHTFLTKIGWYPKKCAICGDTLSFDGEQELVHGREQVNNHFENPSGENAPKTDFNDRHGQNTSQPPFPLR